ncbi:hypothetical protein [Actinophytocola gossypii]|uniref:Uncharacterized protein n=1 Tax=Actinophytocola gossypii TaxID=2812003 RepID=A0ABT2J2C2_9PSEU|nr:hypothetical protein [Actinophytocola gossypii]MCT2581749.1 hypothetical protein [Actinophytocola gossypii]
MVEIVCVNPSGDVVARNSRCSPLALTRFRPGDKSLEKPDHEGFHAWDELLIDAVSVLRQVKFDEDLAPMPVDPQESWKAVLSSQIRRHR